MATLETNVRQVNSDFQAIKNAIVESGVEVAEGTHTSEYGDKVGEVYEAGKQAEYDAFWDEYQRNGTRTSYIYGFGGSGWTNLTWKPKYSMQPSVAESMFYYSAIKGDLEEMLSDLGISLDLSKVTSLFTTFCNTKFSRIGVVDASSVSSSVGMQSVFNSSTSLVTIDKLIVPTSATPKYDSCFAWCSKLKNITIEGEIKKSVNFQHSPLTLESAINVITHLASIWGDGTEFMQTITFSSSTWALLDAQPAEEVAEIIASLGNESGCDNWRTYIEDELAWNYA